MGCIVPTDCDFDNVQLGGDNSFQSSSKMSGDPKELLQNAKEGVESHADLVNAYGYNLPVATLGSHAWLRDELANPSQEEPGNAAPEVNFKVPKRQSV